MTNFVEIFLQTPMIQTSPNGRIRTESAEKCPVWTNVDFFPVSIETESLGLARSRFSLGEIL